MYFTVTRDADLQPLADKLRQLGRPTLLLIAEETGLTPSMLYYIRKHGFHNPHMRTVAALAAYFGWRLVLEDDAHPA